MAYKLTWYAAGEVLHLALKSNLSLEEMKEINQDTLAILDAATDKLTLLLDVSALTAGYATVDSLRSTQKYRDHPKLEAIIVIADNKLNRLITLLAFNLCRALFVQVDSQEKAHTYMSQRGMITSS